MLNGLNKLYLYTCIYRHASGPPGIAEPSINILDVEESFLYLMLMSDGVYKCIEATVEEDQTTGAFSAVGKLFHAFAQYDFTSGSIETLKQLAKIHEKAFNTHRNSTACRKRDDMTLVVYSFCAKVNILIGHIHVYCCVKHHTYMYMIPLL